MRAALGLLVALAVPATSQDWPQWRGPGRDGVASAPQGSAWPKGLKLAWKASVGEGHSAPVVAGERVFVLTRQGEVEELLSLDLATGRLLWRQGEAIPYTMNPAAMGHGKGPKSTPAVRDGKVYTLGISGILTCREAASGRVVWRKDWKGQLPRARPPTARPNLVDGGLVIVHAGGPATGPSPPSTRARARSGGSGRGTVRPTPRRWWLKGGGCDRSSHSRRAPGGLGGASGALYGSRPSPPTTLRTVTPVMRWPTVYYSGLDKGVHAVEIAAR
jgi:hypothetical protein